MNPVLSDEEQEAIRKMEAAAGAFYSMAVRTGVHAFIEFTGLMNEYIKCCAGSPGFMHSNTHNEGALNVEAFQAAYLAEKLDCIYGPTFRKHPELARAVLGGLDVSEEAA
jgi:hypothetical protein